VCTVICLLLGYPVAWAIARGGAWKNFLMFLVILPFWTSFLVRTFAMIFLLRDSGLINTMLSRPGSWRRHPDAVHAVRGDGGPRVRLPAVHGAAHLHERSRSST
jgi:ABC-type spermidine/putrescine transport system permease subunit I